MESRDISYAVKRASKLPVVVISGPKACGKTTLLKTLFKNHKYLTFDDIDTRLFATNDPVQFLNFYKNDYGIILDEVQHAITLFPHIQAEAMEKRKAGYFILASSEKLSLAVQTLTTPKGMLTLLPYSLKELSAHYGTHSVDEHILTGSYPQAFHEDTNTREYYLGYIQDSLERDIAPHIHTKNIAAFYKFMQLCAGHIGQLLNLDTLGEVCGISFATARQWLALLEKHFLIFLLPAHVKTFNKRTTKTPKLYFYDTGIASTLLRMSTIDMLTLHPLRNKLFENFIIADLYKQFFNAGLQPSLFFWRDQNGRYEIDCVLDNNSTLIALEISSGISLTPDVFKKLILWNKMTESSKEHNFLIYAGTEKKEKEFGTIIGWQEAAEIVEFLH